MLDGVGTTRYTYTAVSQILSEDGPWSDDAVTRINRYSQSRWDSQSPSAQTRSGAGTNFYDDENRLVAVTTTSNAGLSHIPI